MSKKDNIKEKIQAIEEIIYAFETNEMDLQDSIANYKRAILIAKELKKDLKNLENEINVINKDFSLDDLENGEN